MKIVVSLLLICLSGLSFANGPAKLLVNDKISIIPSVGLSVNTMSNIESETNGGFYLGAGIRLGKKVHLLTGMYYQAYRINGQIDQNAPGNSNFQNLNSNYLIFPIQIGYHAIYTKYLKIHFAGGALASTYLDGEISSNTAQNLSFSKSLWALRVSAGFDVWRLVFSASYDLGVSDVFVNGLDSKYRALNAGIGFRF